MKVDLKISEVSNLVELLGNHYDNLPTELQNSLKEISETGFNDIDGDYLIDLFGLGYNIESSLGDEVVIVSINKILKKVITTENVIYPESFWLKINGKTVVEW